MHPDVESYVCAYPQQIQALFARLWELATDAASGQGKERLWAKLPSCYVGDRFVRIIPFKDHINVEAAAMPAHAQELPGYRLTPKGMLQLFPGQAFPRAVLEAVFTETLLR